MRILRIPPGTVSVHLLSHGLLHPLVIFSPSERIEKRVLALTTAKLSLKQWKIWLTLHRVPYCIVCEPGNEEDMYEE